MNRANHPNADFYFYFIKEILIYITQQLTNWGFLLSVFYLRVSHLFPFRTEK